jgi:hypothetical protein
VRRRRSPSGADASPTHVADDKALLPRDSYAGCSLGSFPKSEQVAISAFAIHALLLLVDLFFFSAAYAGNPENDSVWPVLRIVTFGLFVWGLLQRAARPWLIGAIACTAFLIRDLVKLSEIFAGPPLGAVQRQLTSALLVSLLVGIGATWLPSASTLFRKHSHG